MKAKMFILGVFAMVSWTPMLFAQQQCYGQVFISPPTTIQVVEPPSIDYILNSSQRASDPHVCQQVHYRDGNWICVPCIKGYVPEIRHVGNKTIYDYRGRILLSRVKYKGKPEPKPRPPRVIERTQKYREDPKPEPPRPPRVVESRSFSEHDGSEWKSGLKTLKTPPKITEIPSLPEPVKDPKPEAPKKTIDTSKSPFRILPPLPKGMERPAKIGEPEKRLVPKYEKP